MTASLIALTRVLLVIVFSVLFGQQSAQAADSQSDQDIFAMFDQVFATYLVAPIEAVLFFDVAFWDDYLSPGEGVDQILDSTEHGREKITDYEYGEYIYQSIYDAPAFQVVPKPDAPVQIKIQGLNFSLSYGENDEGEGTLLASPERVQLNLKELGLADQIEVITDGSTQRTITGIAPMGIVIDGRDGIIQGVTNEYPATDKPMLHPAPKDRRKSLPVPNTIIEVMAGMRVQHDGLEASIIRIEEGVVTLQSSKRRKDATRLANPDAVRVPFVVLWLILGAIFFTLRMGFINIRGFLHAIEVTAGKYDDEEDEGEISHFQALSSALSATVGLGNIAGVAIAIAAGGPGAVLWMVVAAFLGMSSKFTEVTLGQMYRTVDAEGRVSGGPMHYLEKGIKDLKLGPFGDMLGKGLAVLFAVMCIGASLGGGNMFQANQAFAAVADVVPWLADKPWFFGIALAFAVGLVIVGGIKRIGAATSAIVPLMCGMYLVAGVWILGVNIENLPSAFQTILDGAFTADGLKGGVIGVIVQGFQRASFSNEAGVGSASIAHSAASTSEPVREGIVALLEPFIDTIIVCTMTGLVVVVTGVYESGDADGVLMTSRAFATVFSWFPIVLSIAVVLFAFSTMISWSYYGERCVTWLFGSWATTPYRVFFIFCVFVGSVFELGSILDFSDLMVLGMALPNIFGAVMLSGMVKRRLDDYMSDLKNDIFTIHKEG